MTIGKYIFKIVLLGAPGVGKSSLVNRFVHDRFSQSYSYTLGLDLMKKDLVIDGNKITLIVVDIGGQDKFAIVRPRFYMGSKGGFLVFDLTRRDTLFALKEWKDGFLKEIPGALLTVIGNKSDLASEREITHQEAVDFITTELGLPAESYIETSAKTGEQVNDAFYSFARQFLEQCQ